MPNATTTNVTITNTTIEIVVIENSPDITVEKINHMTVPVENNSVAYVPAGNKSIKRWK